MNNENYHDDIIRDLSLLYELSLTFGQSLKMKENSENFIKTLVSRKNLDYGSVWLKSSLLDKKSESEFTLVVAYPEFQIRSNTIEKDHEIAKILSEREYAIIDESKPEFDKINTERRISGGSYIIIKLGKIGFAKFYSSIKKEIFTRKEVNQLKGILQRFAVTLEGSIAYKRAIDEIKARKNAVNEMQALNKRISLIVENLGSAILILDETGKIIQFNSDLEKLTGYERSEINSFQKFKENCIKSEMSLAQFENFPQIENYFEIEIQTKEEVSKRVSVKKSELNHLNKNQLILTFTDITEKLKITADLRLKNYLMERSKSGILISESSELESGILFYNDALAKIFNFGSEEMEKLDFISAITFGNESVSEKLRDDFKDDEFEFTTSLQNPDDQKILKIKIHRFKDPNGDTKNYLAEVENITEINTNIKNSEQINLKLRTLRESISSALVFENAEGTIDEFNDQFAKLINAENRDLLYGKDVLETLSGISTGVKNFEEKREAILKLKVAVKDEEIDFADGRKIKFDYIPVNIHGSYKGCYWLFRDETVSAAEFEESSRLTETVKKLIDWLPVQAALIDTDFKYLYMNNSYEENFHIRDWAIEKEDIEYCKKAGIEKSTAEYRKLNFERVLKDKKSISFEEKRIEKDGARKIILQNIIPILDEKEEVNELVVCGVDVSNLKKAENEIVRIQKQLDALLASVESAVLLFNEEGKILTANTAAEKYFDFDQSELIGKEITSFIEPVEKIESDNVIEKYYKAPLNGSASDIIETTATNRNGDEFPVALKLHFLYGNGKKVYLSVITDKSESLNLSKELDNLKAETEKLINDKKKFFAELRTEFENPLNAFANLSHLLLELEPKTDQKDLLNVLKFSSESMIDFLYDIAKPKDNEEKNESDENAEFTILSVKETLDEVVESIQFAATAKNIKIETHFDPLIPEQVRGKRGLIQKILSKLTLNAVKYSSKGSVRLNCYLIDEDKEKVKIKFVVEDSGIGMDGEKTKNIFVDKEESDSQTAKLSINLPKIKTILEAEGGSISVQSRQNVGSIFVVILNFERIDESENSVENKKSDKDQNPIEGKKFLIIENNEVNLLIIKNLINLWKAEIVTASNSKEAIKQADKFNIDMALIDLSSEDNAGFKAAKELRTEKQNFPILGLISEITSDSEKRAAEYGITGLIHKPFKSSYLKKELTDHLSDRSTAPSITVENSSDKVETK